MIMDMSTATNMATTAAAGRTERSENEANLGTNRRVSMIETP